LPQLKPFYGRLERTKTHNYYLGLVNNLLYFSANFALLRGYMFTHYPDLVPRSN
jgi:hypothetical protein